MEDKKEENKLFAAMVMLAGFATLIIGALIYSPLAWGFVLFKYWYWFVTPVFDNIPNIGYAESVGLMFCVNMFKNKAITPTIKKEYLKDNKNGHSILAYLLPWITILIAYLFKTVLY